MLNGWCTLSEISENTKKEQCVFESVGISNLRYDILKRILDITLQNPYYLLFHVDSLGRVTPFDLCKILELIKGPKDKVSFYKGLYVDNFPQIGDATNIILPLLMDYFSDFIKIYCLFTNSKNDSTLLGLADIIIELLNDIELIFKNTKIYLEKQLGSNLFLPKDLIKQITGVLDQIDTYLTQSKELKVLNIQHKNYF